MCKDFIKCNMEKVWISYDSESIERAIRGYYRSSAFEIGLAGSFSQDVAQMSLKDQGTFLHEYVHFMQNIATPWGIFASIARNNDLAEFVHSIEKEHTITIPYKVTPSAEQLILRKWLVCSLGTIHKDAKIDESRMISFQFAEIIGFQCKMHEVRMLIPTTDGGYERVVLGAGIINECMAAMYQSLIDPNAIHPDIPYNVVQILCRQHFKQIADDKIKLICICYIALFSLDPGYSFMHLLREACLYPDKTGWQMLEEYSHLQMRQGGQDVLVEEFYNGMEDTYKTALRAVLPIEPNYMMGLIDRMKMRNGRVALLEILKSTPFTTEHIQALVDNIGIPYIHTNDGHGFYPSQAPGVAAQDVIIMCGNYVMHEFFTHPDPSRVGICPFNFVCNFPESECYDAPWNVNIEGCTFDGGLQSIHAKGKEIRILKENDVQ